MSHNWYKQYNSEAQPAALAGLRHPAGFRLLLLSILLVLLPLLSQAQNRAISGRVLDAQSNPLPGVTVVVTGTTIGTSTGADGRFELQAPPTATTLNISYVGYSAQQISITDKTAVLVTLREDAQALGDVVVVGYGTARKQDLTGAVSVVGEKEFNKGTYTSPEQLIQGRTSGVQITNASGQPGGAATVKIRGSSAVTGTGQPLYVVDGVPLDGRSARPGLVAANDFGAGTDSNPLNFLNPNDIESLTVLKDASATAIYGSRAAYGVVLINTKRGKTGAPKLDVSLSTGVSSIMRRMDFLDAGQYRQALDYYGISRATGDKGADVDALDAILRERKLGQVQNYSVAMSGGGETGRYRLSLGYLDQDGIIRKTGFKKYSANLSTNLQFLESKKLGVDVNISTSQFREQLAPITNDAGYRGSLIGQALQWNPTEALRNPDGSLFIKAGDVVNPLAAQELYDDNSRVSTILASASPYYKFTDWLEYRLLYSINYSTGERRTSIGRDFINFEDIANKGLATIGNNELITRQVVNTLSYNRSLLASLNLNGVVGYEYTTFANSGSSVTGYGQQGIPGGFGAYGLDYTNYLQFTNPLTRRVSSFIDPSTALQSVFGRAILNYKERYLVTATLRADGSSKFGKNQRYGYFPSFSVAWDVSQEEFFKSDKLNQFKLRAGYGRTGNQEFPAGVAQDRFEFSNNGSGGISKVNDGNDELKWQSDTQFNGGVDLGFLDNRFTATADYFYKTTTDLLFPQTPFDPAPPGTAVQWVNLPGKIINKGVEVALGSSIINTERVEVGLNVNATFIRNNVTDLPRVIPTGAINGQGLSGVQAQVIQSGYPINTFYLQEFQGINEQGQSVYANNGALAYAGSPNPKTLLGLNLNTRFQKLSFVANMTGVFGQMIYNNTLNAVGNVGQIGASKNIALVTFENPVKESTGNPSAASTRYLEKGDFLKLSNATLSYAIGNLGNTFKGGSVYLTGQNLFVITDYTGADPEINTNKSVNGVPSAGIDYIGYPSARTFTLGINFSL
ncbi:SusC/RagA family TonB-linked outer membrane protein [Hymenobacter sp. APR13]|uniref:SusC/RagA family TonB-linked outer membrane protein n=1 Tax=Hymenobacter sp. APR13 TaxID=1356852 RepID=UPI0004E095AD|nr:SusC/RagA family TonB-linked outer membrane protein [Hymenobacter sp. APR13]AII51606.1 hypothetical protein N008_06370 [Hymenobacter sp. APR13]